MPITNLSDSVVSQERLVLEKLWSDIVISFLRNHTEIAIKTTEAARELNRFDVVELSKLLKSQGVETEGITEMLNSVSSAAKILEGVIEQQQHGLLALKRLLKEALMRLEKNDEGDID